MNKSLFFLMFSGALAFGQQQTGEYTDVNFLLTEQSSVTTCKLASGVLYKSTAEMPGCVVKIPTSGGPPRAKLLFPKAQTKCIYLHGTVPSNVDASRPTFFRIEFEQIDGPSTVAPGGCATNPLACTQFSIAPYYLTEGVDLNTVTPGLPVMTDLMATQGNLSYPNWQAKYTGTARGVLDMTQATGRKPFDLQVCRPASQAKWTLHVRHMYIAFPVLSGAAATTVSESE